MSWIKIARIAWKVLQVLWPIIEPIIFSSGKDDLGRPVRRRRWLFRPWRRR